MSLVNKLINVHVGDIVNLANKADIFEEGKTMPPKIGYVKHLSTYKITLSDTDPFVTGSKDIRRKGKISRFFDTFASNASQYKIEVRVKTQNRTYALEDLAYCNLIKKHSNNIQ